MSIIHIVDHALGRHAHYCLPSQNQGQMACNASRARERTGVHERNGKPVSFREALSCLRATYRQYIVAAGFIAGTALIDIVEWLAGADLLHQHFEVAFSTGFISSIATAVLAAASNDSVRVLEAWV